MGSVVERLWELVGLGEPASCHACGRLAHERISPMPYCLEHWREATSGGASFARVFERFPRQFQTWVNREKRARARQ